MLRPLIVLVPNHTGIPETLAPLKELLCREEEFKNAFWIDFDYQEPWYSNKSCENLALNLAATIDAFVHDHKDEIKYIMLAGHSMGSALLRRAYLNASGFGTLEILSQEWPNLVQRIVLMGAFGRGFTIPNQRLRVRMLLGPLSWMGKTFGIGKMRLELLAGADFISRLRVDWITFSRTSQSLPEVIHLLGSNDDIVHPEDVIDLEQFSNATPITVPDATHLDIVKPAPHTETILRRAFTGKVSSNRSVEIKDACNKVFFFLHGIRDSRECFKKVKEKLEDKVPDAKIIVPYYGYLSARGFVNTRYRNSFIPWFIDQISEQLARNPRAEFYVAGHSNGTYILGETLKRIPRIIFSRIYLAASVLPPEFDWDSIIAHRKQTELVRSDMGSEDWPVGVLCRTLNRLGMKSIGPGGFEGFHYGDSDHIAYHRFPGGHSAMLTEENIDSIVDFLLTGSRMKRQDEPRSQSGLFGLFTKFGDILLPMMFGAGCILVAGLAASPIYWPSIGSFAPFLALFLSLAVWIWFGRF